MKQCTPFTFTFTFTSLFVGCVGLADLRVVQPPFPEGTPGKQAVPDHIRQTCDGMPDDIDDVPDNLRVPNL